MGTELCHICHRAIDLNSVVGVHTNQCPHCGNPIFPVPFGGIKNGTVFVCDCGGMWVKFSRHLAVCVEDDSAYRVGENQLFNSDAVVYPF